MPGGLDPYDTLTYDYDCDDNGTYEVAAQTGPYACPYGPRNDGTFTVGVRASDDTTTTSASATITVTNVAPSVTIDESGTGG